LTFCAIGVCFPNIVSAVHFIESHVKLHLSEQKDLETYKNVIIINAEKEEKNLAIVKTKGNNYDQ
jgi:hypothetical protein